MRGARTAEMSGHHNNIMNVYPDIPATSWHLLMGGNEECGCEQGQHNRHKNERVWCWGWGSVAVGVEAELYHYVQIMFIREIRAKGCLQSKALI